MLFNSLNGAVPALLSSHRYPSLGPLIKLAPPFHPLLDVLGVETETRPQVPDRIPPFPLAKKEPSISSCLPPHLTFVHAHTLPLRLFSFSIHSLARSISSRGHLVVYSSLLLEAPSSSLAAPPFLVTLLAIARWNPSISRLSCLFLRTLLLGSRQYLRPSHGNPRVTPVFADDCSIETRQPRPVLLSR